MRSAMVVGAGIGGVTAAVALERCGWHVTVLERAPAVGEVGAGISVWPSTVAVLEQLGIAGVEKSGIPAGLAGMRRPDGRWVVEAAAIGVEIPVMIHRAHLHDLITGRFGPRITVHTGVTVTGISQDADTVTVVAGDQTFRADLVVAADGIRSTVRQALYPAHPGPRYAGYTAYRGIAEADIPDGGGETWGRGRRFGFARLIDGRIYWYATANQPAGTPTGPDGPLADVLTAFGDWHEPIPTLLRGTPPDRVLRNDIHDLAVPLPPFVTGRIVLLGDAAHAMTPNLGRGACSAIEDAGALARHLSDQALRTAPASASYQAPPFPPNLPSALAAYDAERRPVTEKLVRRSRSVGRLGQMDNGLLVGVRDGLLSAGGAVAGLLAKRRRVEESRV